jgi:uncharacterized protein (DUF488 family)
MGTNGGAGTVRRCAIMILTIGHSTHPIEEFLALVEAHGVQQIVDIRTIPKSRRNPQFNSDELAQSLATREIGYVHLPALGGLRHARHDSINTAWRNDSFRGYADYMQSPEFDHGVHALIALSQDRATAIMCAESVPWRCHRSLVADALLARGVAVEHIMSKTSRKPHSYTPFVRIDGPRVTYPGLTNQA